MSKELEKAFNKIKNISCYMGGEYIGESFEVYKDELDLIETALKNYEELTNKPIILYGRTHGYTQALIDTIRKNYKEVKITNLEDEKKLKALEIIKNKNVSICWLKACKDRAEYNDLVDKEEQLTKEEYDVLKEVLL